MKKISYCVFLSGLFAMACASAYSAQRPLKDIDIAVPGYGYLSVFDMPTLNSCLKNVGDAGSVTYSNPEGGLNLSSTITTSQMDMLLGIGVGGTISYGLYDASLKAKYAYENHSDRYQLSLNYAQTYQATAIYHEPKDVAGVNMLTPVAQYLLKQGRDKFYKVCGDSYLKTANAGAVLVATVNIGFASSSDKHKFEAAFEGSCSDLGSVSAELEFALKKSNTSASINVSAIQLGGEPQKLAQIFGKNNGRGYPLLECSSSNLTACSQGISNIVAYASNSFSEQINPEKKDNYYYFDPKVQAYNVYIPEISNFTISDQAKEAINYLSGVYKKENKAYKFVSHYYDGLKELSPTYADPELKFTTQNLANKYQEILDGYKENILENCFSTTANETCQPLVAKIISKWQDFSNAGYSAQTQALIDTVYLPAATVDMSGRIMLSNSVKNQVPNYTFPNDGINFASVANGRMGISGFGNNGSYITMDILNYGSNKFGFDKKCTLNLGNQTIYKLPREWALLVECQNPYYSIYEYQNYWLLMDPKNNTIAKPIKTQAEWDIWDSNTYFAYDKILPENAYQPFIHVYDDYAHNPL